MSSVPSGAYFTTYKNRKKLKKPILKTFFTALFLQTASFEDLLKLQWQVYMNWLIGLIHQTQLYILQDERVWFSHVGLRLHPEKTG